MNTAADVLANDDAAKEMLQDTTEALYQEL